MFRRNDIVICYQRKKVFRVMEFDVAAQEYIFKQIYPEVDRMTISNKDFMSANKEYKLVLRYE